MSDGPDQQKMPFRVAMEARDRAAVLDAFTDDAVIRSPISPSLVFHGREQADALFAAVLAVFENLNYTDELRHGDVGILVLEAKVDGEAIHVVEYLRFADDGRIRELTAFFRPMPALALAARGLGRELARRRGRIRSLVISSLVSGLVVLSRVGEVTVVRLIRSSV